MPRSRKSLALDRRRFLTGAVASAAAIPSMSVIAQDAAPTPVPIRIQTPDLAFVDALQRQLDAYRASTNADGLLLSVVPAEPASDSLLNDLRLRGRRFSGAFVPSWLIPDLVRDDFLLPASPPPGPLPEAIARLRSFGGQWVASELDHDCDLMFYRIDQLEASGQAVPQTWDELLDVATAIQGIGSSIAVPCTYAQQVAGHFCAMASSYVETGPFWFDAESMSPVIDSPGHIRALEVWKSMVALVPPVLRTGSTGDLWQAFIDGSAGLLIASANFLAFALDRGIDPSLVGVAQLPGTRAESGDIVSSGNTNGANWGGVIIEGTTGTGVVEGFFAYLASPANLADLWSDQTTDVLPAPASTNEVAPQSQALIASGWPEIPTIAWLDALQETFQNPRQLIPLRIAETQRYLQALEDQIVRFLSGEIVSAQETLALAASDWRTINSEIDVAVQRDLYARSLMPPPAQ